MKKVFLLLFLCFSVLMNVKAQSYQNPESITFDPVSKRYFISNYAGNSIVQLDSKNKLSNFVTTGLDGPKGLIIIGDKLISVNNTSIQGFLLSNASRVFNISVKGSVFMNDVTSDNNGNIYVSDFESNKIFKITLSTGLSSTINTSIFKPNGLLFDEPNNRILICNWGIKAKIYSINLTTSILTTLVTTKLTDLDGLAMDNCGNIYVSAWGSYGVYVFDPLFQNPPTKISKGHSGPADISIYKDEQILAIPNSNTNTISFVNLNIGCTTGINYIEPKNNSIGLDDSIKIDWEDVPNISEYEIEYSKDSTFYTLVTTTKTTTSEIFVKALNLGTTYFWRVRTIGSENKNIFNNVWKFTTKDITTNLAAKYTSKEFKLFPNPSKGSIFIELPEFQPGKNCYTLFYHNGKIAKQDILNSQSIDVSDLAKGIYLIHLEAGKEIFTKKFIVE